MAISSPGTGRCRAVTAATSSGSRRPVGASRSPRPAPCASSTARSRNSGSSPTASSSCAASATRSPGSRPRTPAGGPSTRTSRRSAGTTRRSPSDIEAIAEGYVRDVVWHGAHAPQGGQLVGRDVVMDVIGGHLKRSDDSTRHQVQDIVGNGEHVIAFLHYHANVPTDASSTDSRPR
ncbi:nuclear transport factor 2 family protein [Streptomyces sp. NPDC055105]|uniref:nuclear transport factor 2 family protein n=1 Tax=Streptomyces sp. NPDC055105 TaxID=3365719 RepID=UPI0037D37769